ncbi:MAG: flagellar type III secretion system protein FliQ [Verrucomicrobiales bacterium]|nr:flagellar type III secretion system protein FliQ [Verrucomicrobiales bacterium]
MTPELATELIKAMMMEAVTIAAPILLTGMSIGLGVSLFQTVTSIQEQTLTFVPKAMGIVGLLVVLLPWMIRTVTDFTTMVIQKMPEMVR